MSNIDTDTTEGTGKVRKDEPCDKTPKSDSFKAGFCITTKELILVLLFNYSRQPREMRVSSPFVLSVTEKDSHNMQFIHGKRTVPEF